MTILLVACGPAESPPRAGDEPRPAGARPNIVLIVIDTLRADHLPFYGYGIDTAPFMSWLAGRGVVFENAFSTSSWTAPATASLFTSLYPQQHGVVTGRAVTRQMRERLGSGIRLNRIPEEIETLPEAMKRAGYATWGISDNFNVCPQMGFGDGFDHLVSDARQYRGGEYVSGVLREWRERLAGKRPYFLYVHYMDPHTPYHLRQPFYRAPAAAPASERLSHLAEDERLEQVALYDSEIGYVDHFIREAFETFGWERDTVLVVTSDHGEEFWDHGHVFHDKTLYEEMLRVPLLVFGAMNPRAGIAERASMDRRAPAAPPALPGAARIRENVGLIDVLPTLREIAGLAPDERAMGRSLLPLLGGGAAPPADRDLFAHLERTFFAPWGAHGTLRAAEGREHYVARSVRRGRWKWIEDSRGETFLFDVAADPGERFDLAEAEPATAAALDAALGGFERTMKTYAAPGFEERLAPEEIDRLRSLGYVE